MSLFGCPTRRAKHAKSSRDSGWLDTAAYQPDNRSLSRPAVGGQTVRKACILQSYESQLSNELSVTTGEIVHIIHHARHWAFVINSEGTKGYIPYAFCGDLTSNVASTSSNQNRPGGDVERGESRQSRQAHLNGSQSMAPPGGVGQTSEEMCKHSRDSPELVDMADTYSLRSSLEPETGKRLGAGANMADMLPFFKVPYGKSAVLFDFEGEDENDLPVGRGETVVILNQDDPGWVWVRKDDRREGFVPRMYICPCGCTSIHEQIVESLQVSMHRQQTRNFVDTRKPRQNGNAVSQPWPNQTSGASRFRPAERDDDESTTGNEATSVSNSKTSLSTRPFSDTDFEALAGLYQRDTSSDKMKATSELWSGGAGGERMSLPGEVRSRKLSIQCDYRASGKDELTVYRGDLVLVTEQGLQNAEDMDWLFVYSVRSKRSGYVPKTCMSNCK